MEMLIIPLAAGGSALLALLLAFAYALNVNRAEPGTPKMVEIMIAIQTGARAFLKREYISVAIFMVAMAIVIGVLLDWGWPWGIVTYISGAILSALAGYIGMTIATRANARTAAAAQHGASKALPLAFRGGAVMGFSVAGLALLGLCAIYLLFVEWAEISDAFEVITAFGLGASTIALFSRVGGGIYTKAADVGADLVGKVEAGIPEDDPRNPATIADNVGDNVGDVAGMGADLFESYAGSIIAPMAFVAFAVSQSNSLFEELLLFPLAIAGVGMVFSMLGSFTVRTSNNITIEKLSRALHRGTNIALLGTVAGTFLLGYWLFEGSTQWQLPLAVVAGLVAGYLIGKVAEYWTSDHYSPVKQIAKQSETGPATTILSGISGGMISVAASVVLISIAIGVSYWVGDLALGDLIGSGGTTGGIYGIAIAAIGMLSTLGVIVAVDAYGPIADNAGGIAEMAEMPSEVREVTDSLDSLGNTTAAIAKGFAVGSAAITALALFAAFDQAITKAGGSLDLNITKVEVFIGLFAGAMLPFLFAALTISAVGRAANQMIEEVRRQFREIPGLREGAVGARPDSARCVDISTKASLKEMILPGGLAVVVPIVFGFISVNALGGFLAGALVSGFALAIFMSNSGGAWDNAKKYIEAGNHGGKGSEPHKAAVVGDTVGDPFKDTSGPSMNILIKVMTIVSLIFASAFI